MKRGRNRFGRRSPERRERRENGKEKMEKRLALLIEKCLYENWENRKQITDEIGNIIKKLSREISSSEINMYNGDEKYIQLLKELTAYSDRNKISYTFSNQADETGGVIAEGHALNVRGENVPLKMTGIYKSRIIDKAYLLDEFNTEDIDYGKSKAWMVFLKDEEQRFSFNCKVMHIVDREGEEKRVLYILERYIDKDYRSEGIGNQILDIADKMAMQNGCSFIYGQLVSEDLEDMDKLKQGHEKNGYSHYKRDNHVMTKKIVQ